MALFEMDQVCVFVRISFPDFPMVPFGALLRSILAFSLAMMSSLA